MIMHARNERKREIRHRKYQLIGIFINQSVAQILAIEQQLASGIKTPIYIRKKYFHLYRERRKLWNNREGRNPS